MAVPAWYEETLARQLVMAPQTWAVLQGHGVDESTPLTLDFAFDAPGEARAGELLAFLRLETDYEVDVHVVPGGLPQSWSVSGSTHATELSQTILEDWVRWMVAAGAQYGGCRFDGWGAGVPGAR